MKLSICIISSNDIVKLRECLRSVCGTIGADTESEIFVVENNPSEGISKMLELEYPEINVIKNDKEKGFSENNNSVTKSSSGKNIVFLNDDVIVTGGFFKELLKTIESDSRIGCVSGKLLLGEPGIDIGRIDSAGVIIQKNRRTVDRGQGDIDKGQYDEQEEVFSASAAALLCKREMLEDIKLFDEYFDGSFFMYKEDTDLCWRARLKGWNIIYNPKAVAYHLRGWKRSTERKKIPAHIRRHSYKNRYLMMIKNDHLINILRDIPFIIWYELKALAYIIFREPHLLLAWFQIILLLPITLRKRHRIMEKAVVNAKEMRKWFV